MMDIIRQRLHNQRLSQTAFQTPAEVVEWLGAVQSQDYPGAKWAVAQRTTGLSDAALDQAFAEGTILRTHILRPTWHFITPADIRWMLMLTAPRILTYSASMHRKLEMDTALFTRSNEAIAKALEANEFLTRAELAAVLQGIGIETLDLRIIHLMAYAELEGIICSGPRRGKEFTYALLDKRAPNARTLERDEALAELALRYFTSHGPATLKDYTWWSGLTVGDARAALEMVKSRLHSEAVDDQTYWFAELAHAAVPDSAAYLLPNYDEYIVGYTDRSAIYDEAHTDKLDSRGNVLFNHTIVLDGLIAGTWKRAIKKGVTLVEITPFRSFTEAENQAVAAAASRYGDFLEMPASVTY
jgi:hypothetical protein